MKLFSAREESDTFLTYLIAKQLWNYSAVIFLWLRNVKEGLLEYNETKYVFYFYFDIVVMKGIEKIFNFNS